MYRIHKQAKFFTKIKETSEFIKNISYACAISCVMTNEVSGPFSLTRAQLRLLHIVYIAANPKINNYLFIHLFIHSFNRSINQSINQSFICSFVHLLIHSFILPFVHSSLKRLDQYQVRYILGTTPQVTFKIKFLKEYMIKFTNSNQRTCRTNVFSKRKKKNI